MHQNERSYAVSQVSAAAHRAPSFWCVVRCSHRRSAGGIRGSSRVAVGRPRSDDSGGGARRPNGRFVSAETGRSPTLRPGHSADPTRNIEDWQLSIPQVMYLVARSARIAALQ